MQGVCACVCVFACLCVLNVSVNLVEQKNKLACFSCTVHIPGGPKSESTCLTIFFSENELALVSFPPRKNRHLTWNRRRRAWMIPNSSTQSHKFHHFQRDISVCSLGFLNCCQDMLVFRVFRRQHQNTSANVPLRNVHVGPDVAFDKGTVDFCTTTIQTPPHGHWKGSARNDR